MKKLYSLDDIENLSIDNVFDLYKKYVNFSQVELISSFGFGQDLVEKAEGMYIYTRNGKKILDFTGGVGVLNLGHNHPRIIKARQEYSNKMKMEVHKNYFSPHIAALSSNIANLLPEKLSYSYFQNSGAEAVEGAMKLAYKFHKGQRDVILSSDISFHGKTIAASNITNSIETSYFNFQETLKNDKFIYNSIESVKNKILEYTINGKVNIYAIIIGASLLIINRSEFLNGRNGGFLRVFLWIVITGLVGFLTNVAPYIVIDNLDAFFAGVYMMTQDLIPQRMPITITRMVTVIYEQNLLVLMLTILSLCSIVYSLSIFSIKKISINRSLNDVITIVFICPLLLMLLIFTKHFHRHYLQLFVPFLAIGVGLFFPLLKNKFINFLSNIKTKTIWATTIFFVVIFCLEIFFKDFVNVYFTIWKKIDPIYPKIEKIISMQPKNKSDFLFLNDTRVHWTLQEPRHGFPAQGNTVHIIVWGAWDKFNMPEYFNHPTNAEEYCAELEKRGPTILIIRKMPNFKKLCLRKSSVYNFEEKLSDNVSLFKRN